MEPASPTSMHADGRHAQMVALAAAWNALCGALLRRSVPVLFAPVSDYFTGSKRQPAAWLATLIYSFAYAFGPLTGGMLRRRLLSHCLLSVLGTLCIGLGQAASFALTDLNSFIAVLGILVGIGTGVTQVVNEALLSMHFENRRNRASLLAYAGSTLAALVYPGILMAFVDMYGLHGALLLTAGLALNGLAGSVMLRKPTWITADDPDKQILMVAAAEVDPPLPTGTTGIGNSPAVSPEGGDQNADGVDNPDAAATTARERPSSGPLVVVCAILTALTLSSAMVLYDYVAVELRQGHAMGMGVLVTTALGDLLARMGTDAFLWTVSDRRLALTVQCLLNGGILFLMSVFDKGAQLVILGLGFGWTSGSLITLMVPVLKSNLDASRVQFYAVLSRFAAAAALPLGPVLVGVFKDGEGSYSGLLLVSGLFSLIGGFIWLPVILNDSTPSDLVAAEPAAGGAPADLGTEIPQEGAAAGGEGDTLSPSEEPVSPP